MRRVSPWNPKSTMVRPKFRGTAAAPCRMMKPAETRVPQVLSSGLFRGHHCFRTGRSGGLPFAALFRFGGGDQAKKPSSGPAGRPEQNFGKITLDNWASCRYNTICVPKTAGGFSQKRPVNPAEGGKCYDLLSVLASLCRRDGSFFRTRILIPVEVKNNHA